MRLALSITIVGLYLATGLLLEWRARPRLRFDPDSRPAPHPPRAALEQTLARRRAANRFYLLGGVAAIVLLLLLNVV